MSTLELKELSHPSGEVIKIASGKTLDLKSQGSVTMPSGSVLQVVNFISTAKTSQSASTHYFISFLYGWGIVSFNNSIFNIFKDNGYYQHCSIQGSSSSYTVYRTTSSGSTNIGGGNNGFARLTGANNT